MTTAAAGARERRAPAELNAVVRGTLESDAGAS
jgi:hypothetical protein